MDNYHYPLGADTEDAPWNQKEVPESAQGKSRPIFTFNRFPGELVMGIERVIKGQSGSSVVIQDLQTLHESHQY